MNKVSNEELQRMYPEDPRYTYLRKYNDQEIERVSAKLEEELRQVDQK